MNMRVAKQIINQMRADLLIYGQAVTIKGPRLKGSARSRFHKLARKHGIKLGTRGELLSKSKKRASPKRKKQRARDARS